MNILADATDPKYLMTIPMPLVEIASAKEDPNQIVAQM